MWKATCMYYFLSSLWDTNLLSFVATVKADNNFEKWNLKVFDYFFHVNSADFSHLIPDKPVFLFLSSCHAFFFLFCFVLGENLCFH